MEETFPQAIPIDLPPGIVTSTRYEVGGEFAKSPIHEGRIIGTLSESGTG